MDEPELSALVGRWAYLRPTDGQAVVRAGRVGPAPAPVPPAFGTDSVEVAVVSSLDRVLRCETRDRRAVALGGRPVVVEFGANEAMVRVPGTVRVMIDKPLPIVLAVTAIGPLEHLQRRQWVRAQVVVPVELRADAHHGGGTVRTTTIDLSGGGVRIKMPDSLPQGEELRLVLWLPDGPIEVDGTVLDDTDGQSVRVAFDHVPESVSKRLVRFVFDVQVKHRRRVDS